MSKTLHLYASGSDFSKVSGAVGLLCEFAADSPGLKNAGLCYVAEELLGSPDAALALAYPLVSAVLHTTPVIDGLPLLYVFEESLLEEFSHIVQAFHLDHWIANHDFSSARFVSHSPWLDRLLQVRTVTGSSYALAAAVKPLQTSRGIRAIREFWESRPKLPEAVRRILPVWSRHLSASRMRRLAAGAPRGGIWFYSTAYNCTRVGLQYEPYLPQKVTFLVEDPTTGGRGLRELERDSYWVYAWSQNSDIPSSSEVRSIGRRITAAFSEAELTTEQSALRTVLLQSEWWQHFLARRLGFAIYNNRVLQRWRHSVGPEMLVVGNAGWERALLLNQNADRIPTVLLQHGVMHWTYAVTDEPVDTFLLRGRFFQRVINDRLRRKTAVQNIPETAPSSTQLSSSVRDSILFITAPYNVPEFFHLEDLRDIVRSLLRVAHSTRRGLVMRVHPTETVESYRQLVGELSRELGISVQVTYSQGPGAEEVLARSSVAVLFFSTMFLDCLRHGIPIVGFGWHWFPKQRPLSGGRRFQLRFHFEPPGSAGGRRWSRGRLPQPSRGTGRISCAQPPGGNRKSCFRKSGSTVPQSPGPRTPLGKSRLRFLAQPFPAFEAALTVEPTESRGLPTASRLGPNPILVPSPRPVVPSASACLDRESMPRRVG